MIRSALVVAVLLAGCAESVSPEPLGDYTAWKRLDVIGEAPGHGDTYRIIYANDIASDPASTLYHGYPEGSVIVKEIYENDGDRPGALKYVAIMRRLGVVTTALVDQGGWLFSQSSKPNGAETHTDRCWDRCHVAAPFNGAWYDYRK